MKRILEYLDDWYWSTCGITYPYWRWQAHRLLRSVKEGTKTQ